MGDSIREDLHTILDDLSDRECRVITLRFGLEDGKPRTLEEVGELYSITKERIRQIESEAIQKLRDSDSKLTQKMKEDYDTSRKHWVVDEPVVKIKKGVIMAIVNINEHVSKRGSTNPSVKYELKAIAKAFDKNVTPGIARAIYMAMVIISEDNNSAIITASFKELVKTTGFQKVAVIKHLKILETKGFIKSSITNGSTSGKTNNYTLYVGINIGGANSTHPTLVQVGGTNSSHPHSVQVGPQNSVVVRAHDSNTHAHTLCRSKVYLFHNNPQSLKIQ